MDNTDINVDANEDRKLSKSQKKRLKEYQALGTNSKARSDKEKFDARYAALSKKSFNRRKKLDRLSTYEQFCELLSEGASKTLNPAIFLDFVVSLISVYVGQNQTVSISKYTSNNHINNAPLAITHIDQLIPYYAPRDKISFRIPSNIQKAMQRSLQTEQEEEKETLKDEVFSLNASYAFGALPDQRLLQDNKCIPYVMDETFRWTILYGTKIRPPKFRGRESRNTFDKIVAAAIISDGCGVTYCIYGTRDGLFYNKDEGKPIKIIDQMVDGIFRQNDYLFAVCQGPVLYNVSLTTKNGEIAVSEVFRTKNRLNVYTFFNSFIGGYYDSNKDLLILATNNAQIYVFENNGAMDEKFSDRYEAFLRREDRLEKGNVLYFDVDRNCVVYIGTKYVVKVSLDKDKDGNYAASDDAFAKVYDIKWFLRGITYDCNYWMYIYHQKTLVILKRVQSSAQCPYVLKIYTGKSLRFE